MPLGITLIVDKNWSGGPVGREGSLMETELPCILLTTGKSIRQDNNLLMSLIVIISLNLLHLICFVIVKTCYIKIKN